MECGLRVRRFQLWLRRMLQLRRVAAVSCLLVLMPLLGNGATRALPGGLTKKSSASSRGQSHAGRAVGPGPENQYRTESGHSPFAWVGKVDADRKSQAPGSAHRRCPLHRLARLPSSRTMHGPTRSICAARSMRRDGRGRGSAALLGISVNRPTTPSGATAQLQTTRHRGRTRSNFAARVSTHDARRSTPRLVKKRATRT
jgi:hypothetical protein